MNPLKQKLDINNERYLIIVSIKEDYLDGKLSLEEGNRILKEKLGSGGGIFCQLITICCASISLQ